MKSRISLGLIGMGCIALAATGIAAQPAATLKGVTPLAPPFHVVKTWELGGLGGWDYLAVDSEAGRLYVPRSTRVMVIDCTSGKQAGEIANTEGVHGVAIASSLGRGFTSNGRADTTTVFDLKTLKTIQTVGTGKNPDAILFEPTTRTVFTFNGKSHDATAINAASLAVLGTIPLGGKPEFAVEDGKGKIYVNIEDTSEIVRLNAATRKLEGRWSIAPGAGPSGLAIDPAGHRLFSVCSNGMMVVVDTESGRVLATPKIGKGVDGAAFDAGGGYALSSNGEGSMTVVETAGAKPFEVAQTLTTYPGARTVVIDPKTRLAYLPAAEIEAKGEDATHRPTIKPGTFRIIVLGPQGREAGAGN